MSKRNVNGMKDLIDQLWEPLDVARDWESEDIDLAGEFATGRRRAKGDTPENVAVNAIIEIVAESEEWGSDLLEEVANVAREYWEANPELVGRRLPTDSEQCGWHPDFGGDEALASAYYAIGTVGNQACGKVPSSTAPIFADSERP